MLYERLQLPLPFQHQPGYDAQDFLPSSSNEDALAWLKAEWPDRRLALFGPAGCGKSHLLHIWAKRTGAVLLVGQALMDLDAVPQTGALALDDADTVLDETLLFHLLNTAKERGLATLAGPPARSFQPPAGDGIGGNSPTRGRSTGFNPDAPVGRATARGATDRAGMVAVAASPLPRRTAGGGRSVGSNQPRVRLSHHPVAGRQGPRRC